MKKGYKFIFLFLSALTLGLVLVSCNKHMHTYSSEWAYDDANHWHQATCEHKDEKSDLGKHSFGAWSVEAQPTDTTEGQVVRSCSVCQKKEITKLPVLSDENYNVSIVDATCTDKGSKTYKWKVDESISFTFDLPLSNHTYGSWEILVEPTKETTGSAKRTCTNTSCDSTQTIVLPAIDEANYDIVEVGGGCEEDFSGTYTYKFDSSIVITVTKTHTGHSFSNFVIGTEPTEDSTGTATRVCSSCAKVETIALPKLSSDDYDIVEVPATCLVKGSKTYTLKENDEIVITKELDIVNHDFNAWGIEEAPTETAKGVKVRTCNVGGETEREELPILSEEDYTLVVTEPKVGLAGSKVYTLKSDPNIVVTIQIPERDTYTKEEIISTIRELASKERAKVYMTNENDADIDIMLYDNILKISFIEASSYQNQYFYFFRKDGKLYWQYSKNNYETQEVLVQGMVDILNKDRNMTLNEAVQMASFIATKGTSVLDMLYLYTSDNFDLVYSNETKVYKLEAKTPKNVEDPFDYFHNDQIVNISNYSIASLVPAAENAGVSFATNEAVEVELPKFANPTWYWAANPDTTSDQKWLSASASVSLANYPNDYGLLITAAFSVEKVDATDTTSGSVTYTASITLAGETFKDVKTEVIPALTLTYDVDNIDWHWNDDYSVVVTIPCIEDTAHNIVKNVVSTIDATKHVDASCKAAGKDVYVASIDFKGETYTNSKDKELPLIDHSYTHIGAVEATCFKAGNIDHYKCFTCGKYFDADYHELTEDEVIIPKLKHGVDTLVERTYVFTSKAWADATDSWNSVKDGGYTDGRGVQVTTTIGSATGETKEVLKDVTKVVIIYKTNQSAGIGKISVKVGDNEAIIKDAQYQNLANPGDPATKGYEANYELVYEFATPVTGKLQVSITDVTENSIYVYSVKINYTDLVMPHHDAVPATCEDNGEVEYWYCEKCNTYFSDEKGENVITDLVELKKGHDYVLDQLSFENGSEFVDLVCKNDASHTLHFTEANGEMTITDDNGVKVITVNVNNQEFVFRGVKSNVVLANNAEHVTLTKVYGTNNDLVPSEGLYAGTTVKVTVTADLEYKLKTITYGNQAVEVQDNIYTKEFNVVLGEEDTVINVTVEKGTFLKATSLSNLDFENKAYAFIILNGNEAWDGSITGDNLKTGGKALTNVEITNGYINSFSLDKVFYISKVAGQSDKYVLRAANGKYLTSNASGKELVQSNQFDSSNYLHISFDESYNVLIQSNTATNGYIRFNPNSSTETDRKGIFKFYDSIADSTTNKHIQLYYRELTTVELISSYVSLFDSTYKTNENVSYLSLVYSDIISYSVPNEYSSRIHIFDDQKYVNISLPTSLACDITLNINLNGNKIGETSFHLDSIDNSKLTVDQAYALVDVLENNVTTENKILVEGTIEQITDSKHITFLTTNSEEFIIYLSNGGTAAKFDGLYVGDTLIFQGYGKKYNSTNKLVLDYYDIMRVGSINRGVATLTFDSTNSSDNIVEANMITYSKDNFKNGDEITITIHDLPTDYYIKSVKINNTELEHVGNVYSATLAHTNNLVIIIAKRYSISFDSANSSTGIVEADMITYTKSTGFTGDEYSFTIHDLPEFSTINSVKVGGVEKTPENGIYSGTFDEADLSIVIILKTLQSIAISGDMAKISYNLNDNWDPAGLVVTATYSVGDPVVITDDVEWSYNPATANDSAITSLTVTATYNGKTYNKDISGISVSESSTKYTISFESNGGTTVDQQLLELNQTVTKPTDPTKEGYTFEGWYTRSGSEAPYTYNEYSFTTQITDEFTLYAKWKKTLVLSGVTSAANSTVNTNTALKLGVKSAGGSCTVSVGNDAVVLVLYAASWNGETNNIAITGVTATPNQITLTSDSGIAGSSSSYTLNGEIENYKNELILTGLTNSETEITITSNKRVVVWGAYYTNF